MACRLGRADPDGVRAEQLLNMSSRVATQQFEAVKDGETVIVLRGARFAANDPIVKANPTLFETPKRKRSEKAA